MDQSLRLNDTEMAKSDAYPLVPPAAPIPMRVQELDVWNTEQAATVESEHFQRAVNARLAILLILAGLTGYALYEMLGIVGFGEAAGMQFVLVALFTATFSWMAVGAANAIVGFITLIFDDCVEADLPQPHPSGGRTAIVMPVCNEDPKQTFACLSRMADELSSETWRKRIEFFVLSDTRDPSIGMNEFYLAGMLAQRFAGRLPFYYRRRRDNEGRKAGNIAEFIRCWGGRYEYMIVLDADSYLTTEAIGGLIAAMDDDPRAGLIQASIRLAGRESLFARIQQFSSAVFGQVATAGAALWQGRDGNFNGHNAIVRVSAFAMSCGLPELPGGKPFGGHILSHDFVEAALLRRAGWDVYTRRDIDGTYEESPPNLIEYFKRDRRWMQGNLQHSRVLSAAGLHWMSRWHLLSGIMTYLSPILWLLFLLVGMAIAVYTTVTPQDYFPETRSLFPKWPTFDAERATWLMAFVITVVLLPKIFGYIHAIIRPDMLRQAGGLMPLTLSTCLEIIVTALMAPVHMIIQTIHLVEILRGEDSGWPSQDRNGSSIPLAKAARHFALPSLVGAALAVGSYSVSLSLFLWLAPIWGGLILAIPLAVMTASRHYGRAARQANLFLTEGEHGTEYGSLATMQCPRQAKAIGAVEKV